MDARTITGVAREAPILPAPNQFRVRTIIRATGKVGRAIFQDAQRERELVKRRIRRAKNKAAARARERAYREKYLTQPGKRELERERKRRWREANRAHYNAYFRRYDELTPGRKEYKARKAREYRARDKTNPSRRERGEAGPAAR